LSKVLIDCFAMSCWFCVFGPTEGLLLLMIIDVLDCQLDNLGWSFRVSKPTFRSGSFLL